MIAGFRLAQLVASQKPDVVHAHSSKAGALVRAISPFMRRRPSVFYTPNAYYGLKRDLSFSVATANIAERFLGRVGTTINVSDEESEFAGAVLRIPESRRTVIHNSVDARLFRPADASERRECRRKMGLPEDATILGSVGRLSFQKDPLTLLHALAPILRSNQGKLIYAYLGTGEMLPEWSDAIQKLGIEPFVKQIEYLKEPAAFYQALDGFALASRYEGLSLAILEALATGLPIIISDAPGNRTFLSLGLSHAWHGRVGDSKSFEEAIGIWLEGNPGSLQTNHREIVAARFDVATGHERLLGLYSNGQR
jgi:glycosyltransferase involved in cell wall biosynthesis